MVVISDTTAITNLHQIKLLIIIRDLYGGIIIPQAVYDELSVIPEHRQVLKQTNWIKVVKTPESALLNDLLEILDRGEAEAIALAVEQKSDLLIIDEQKGRKVAVRYGLRTIGILGILINAKKKGLIPEIKPYLNSLIKEAGFYLSKKLFREILKAVNE